MTREEDLIRATTSAIASTVSDVPPLRLAPATADPAEAARFMRGARGARRLRGWLAPVTAAAVVLVIAAALVIIRDIPNGRVVPPTTSASPSTAGVPKYYVMVDQGGDAGKADGLLVGDTFTGKTVARVAPPQGGTFAAVTGAADDRTFVAYTTGYPQRTARGARQNATWYLITLAPGSSSPARLTRLSIPATMNVGYIESVALSNDGRELAVAYVPNSRISLRIYSMATGQLLNSWSTSNSKPPAVGLFADGFLSNTTLSWVDDDRALAFATSTDIRKPKLLQSRNDEAVRVLDVTARGGDLIADSRVVWSRQDTPFIAFYTRPVCNTQGGSTVPTLAANGKTVVCAGIAGITHQHKKTPKQRSQVRLVWLGFSASAPSVARTLYQVTAYVTGQDLANTSDLRWTDASGSSMIIDWSVGSSGPGPSPTVHFGLVRNGTFTPLPTPPGTGFYALFNQANIAW